MPAPTTFPRFARLAAALLLATAHAAGGPADLTIDCMVEGVRSPTFSGGIGGGTRP